MSTDATHRPVPDPGSGRRCMLSAAAGLLLGFLIHAQLVAAGFWQALDTAVLHAIARWHGPVRDAWVMALTDLGHEQGVIPLTVVLVVVLAIRRQVLPAVFVVVAMAGAGGVNALVKHLVQRQRPALWEPLTHETTWSFPSGHAMGAVALAVVLTLLAWPGRWRWPVLLAGGLFALLAGLSRLYLGVHWPSDIIGAWLLAPAWVLAVHACMPRQGRRDLCRSADIS